MTRRRLPIGMQTFRELREADCYYVDKTAQIARLVKEGKHYGLSRPRRFGKSLLLDTLKELFKGNEALFEGLAIHDRWDWSVRHPVVHLSFGGACFRETRQAEASLMAQLDALEREAGAGHEGSSPAWRFHALLRALHERTGRRVAVLVDEHDKPILDALDAPEAARANRDFLYGFYNAIKEADAHVEFSFLSGVTRYATSPLISGLNLIDISLDRRCGTLCGFTDADLDSVFAPELPGLDREEIRAWYGGYNWRSRETVYNPHDILRLFDRREFKAHWFEAGPLPPAVDPLLRRCVDSLALEEREEMVVTIGSASRFDVEDVEAEALLFQAGYLTIVEEQDLGGNLLLRLDYPNRAVKQALNEHLLRVAEADAPPRA